MFEENLYHRFINLLGVTIKTPTYSFLSELVRAHLSVIPFENISKIYYKTRLGLVEVPPFELYLEGVEEHHFGGTCYSNNYYFFKLLQYLGYEVVLCAADMKNPGSHMVSMVTLENKTYLVDVGYAAPFTEAVPLDLEKDHEIVCGRDRYVFKPRDQSGSTQLLMFRNGSYKHGYTARPGVRRIEDFSEVISNSFLPGSTFFNTLLLTKYESGRFCILHNLEFIESTAGRSVIHQLSDLDEMVQIIEKTFKIKQSITRDILSGIRLTGDAWN